MADKIIAVDLGGTNMRVSLIKNHKILRYIKEKTPKQKDKLINLLFGLIRGFLDDDVIGIGVACPGPLENGIIKNPPNLPLKNYNLKKALQKEFKKRIEIENDANCVAIAEINLGYRKKNFLILTLGTGIGGGIIIDRKLYRGEGYGGELGHLVINNETFEDSWKKNRELCKKYFGEEVMMKHLLEMKNKKSKEIVEKTVKDLAKGIASLINIFDPQGIILAGGIRETGDKLLKKIKKEMKKYILLPRIPEIKWTELEHAGSLGASLLIK